MKNYLFILIVSVLFASCEKEQPEEPFKTLTIECGNIPFDATNPDPMGINLTVNDVEYYVPCWGHTIEVIHPTGELLKITAVNTPNNENKTIVLRVLYKGKQMLYVKSNNSLSSNNKF